MHAPLLHLPYYWDELGQFVPASLDLYHTGALVPYTTVPNVHPPGLMAYLAGVWYVAGYSVLNTRLAMLLLGSAGAMAVFLLAIQLCRSAAGMPAFAAVLFLICSPLFFAQSMLAQLDMPAMVFTCFALLLFLRERFRASALVCVLLVMVKETGIVAPFVFGCWLWFEKRRSDALWFLLPLLPLALWLALLRSSTGHLFGNAAFTEYNVFYNLHPVRLVLALARRLYYLFVGTFHWIGTVAVMLTLRAGGRLFRNRAWAVAVSIVVLHVVLVSVMGGAVLERYLLPALPIIYIAFAAVLPGYAAVALLAGLIANNFINPPYPFPFENNLAFSDFVELHEKAASFVESHYPESRIETTFPLAQALARPEFGYVSRKMQVREISGFRPADIKPEEAEVFVLYPTMLHPYHISDRLGVGGFLHRFYGYEPDVSAETLTSRFQMRSVARWTRRGQWIEIFVKSSAPREPPPPPARRQRALAQAGARLRLPRPRRSPWSSSALPRRRRWPAG